jgi:hypothetical protein
MTIEPNPSTHTDVIGYLSLHGTFYEVMYADWDVGSNTGDFLSAVCRFDPEQYESIASPGQIVNAALLLFAAPIITCYSCKVHALEFYPERRSFVLLVTESWPGSTSIRAF